MKENQDSYSFKLFLSEVRSLWELAGFWKEKKNLKNLPANNTTNPIMVLPGFFTNDLATSPLRKLLRQKGFACYGWGLGLNKGYHPETLEKLREKIELLHGEHGSPVILIGWSLGGIYARELGRHHPERIRKIITLGSPFYLPARTPVDKLYRRTAGHDIRELDPLIKEHREFDFPMPLLAISAKKDGVIPWQTCLTSKNHTVKCFVLKGGHTGLLHNHRAIRKILEDLSRN